MEPNETTAGDSEHNGWMGVDSKIIETMPRVTNTEVIKLSTKNNGISHEKSSNSVMDSQIEIKSEAKTTEAKEPPNNIEEPEKSGEILNNENNNIDTMPDVISAEENESPDNNNEKKNTDNNSTMDTNEDTTKTSVEVMEPSNNNDETQGKSDHSPLVMDAEIENMPELTITGVIEPTNKKNENSIDNSDSSSKMELETTIEVTKTEVAEPPNDNTIIPIDNADKSVNENVDSDIESTKSEAIDHNDKETEDNSSSKKLEHMMSLKVVLERTKYYGCDKCNLVFFRPYEQKLHAVKHVLPSKRNSDTDDRFVKRFKCDACDARFVQLSTLDAHAAVHAPPPHVCHCGVGFHSPKDLNSHKNLVHIDEIRDQFSTLTVRQQRALKHEIWEPNVLFTVKKEPKSRPTLKVALKTKKPRKKPVLPRYRCEEEKLIVQNDDKTFSCPICSKTFKSKSGTQIHLGSHAKVKPYGCNLCDKRFTQVAALNTHKKLHTGVKEFKCSFCGKEFSVYHNMLNHIRTHTGEKPFKCVFCPKAFSDPSAHKRHERTHTGEKPYSCKFCGMRFSDASGLIAHERRHNGTRQIQCTQCPKMFWTNDCLRKHTTSVHSYEKNFPCKICNKSFAIKSYLAIHMKSHFGTKRFECDYCAFRTRSKLNLIRHIQFIHMQIRNEECPDCGMRFHTKKVMQNHRAIVHSRPLNYECDLCGERQSVKNLIAKHILEKHPEVRCKICRKPFANGADLQKHSEKGCLQCQCGKYFQSRGLLNQHRVAHDVKRPYMCSYCDRRFKKKYRLRAHYETIHENTKKYECNECGKQFSVRNHLEMHIYTIHFTLLYCHVCMRHFFSESDLKAHKAKRHTINKHQCDVCGKVFVTKYGLTVHLQIHGDANFYCAHCPRKFKLKRSIQRHLQLCHKNIFRTKSKRSK